MTYISIGKLCVLLGISVSTAYRWIKAGKITEAFRTVGNHRRFNVQDIEQQFLSRKVTTTHRVVVYARVSSHDQKHDLIRQEQKLLDYCQEHHYTDVAVISDCGSGLNYKKSGLKKLLQLILHQKIDLLIINHKDRLLRFGSELIFSLCEFYHVNVVILEEKKLSFEEELSHDVIELMTVFCAKLYGRRSHKNKTIKQKNLSTPLI